MSIILKANILADKTVKATTIQNTVKATIKDQGPQGLQGEPGPQGIPGTGVPSGGLTGQALAKVNNTDYNTAWTTIDKTFLGLGNVTNNPQYYPGGTDVAVTDGGTGASTLSGVLKGNGTSPVTGSATINDLGTTTGNFSMNSHKITNLLDPTSAQDATTKSYVDARAGVWGTISGLLTDQTDLQNQLDAKALATHTHLLDDLSDVMISSPTTGDVLSFDGLKWVNAVVSGGSGGTGVALTYNITQTAHGFVVGDVLKSTGTNTYAKAQANSAANAEVVGIVTAVINANSFTLTTEGVVTSGVPGEAGGAVLFLDPSTAGALTVTEPTATGEVSKPLAIVIEPSVKMVFKNFRGELIADAVAGGLTVSEIDGTPSVSGITGIKVSNGSLTDNLDGTVTILTGGGGGGGGSITVQEIDGTPAVASVSTIKVTNGTLTDNGGGVVTINTGGSGDASGPSSATDNALARFDGTTGKLIQNSGVILDDSNNLSGLGTISSGAITSTGTSSLGSLILTTDLPITEGGTGASDATNARINLGLGSISTQASSLVSITGGSVTGITDLAIADGGTGASTAAGARTNLGVVNIAGDTMTGLLQFSGTTHAGIKLNSLTTTQRDALTALNGMFIYNSTLLQAQKYENSEWVDISKSPGTKTIAPAGSGYAADYYTDGTNDEVQFNLAFASANKVVAYKGNYYLADNILMPSNSWFQGMGIGLTVFYLTATKGFKNANYTTTGNTNITISDCTIDGQAIYDQAVQFRGVTTGLLDRVQIRNIDQFPFDSPTVAVGIVGLAGVVTKDIMIRDCFLQDIADYGINMDPLSTFEVLQDITIIGCHLKNVETGFATQRNCKSILISENTYEYPGGVCIGYKGCPSSDASHLGEHITVSNNIFINADTTATSTAISVGNYNYHCKVDNNTIQGFENGIYLNFHPFYAQVTGNKVVGSTYGIRDVSAGEYSKIDNNYVYGCAEYGIWMNSPVSTMNSNTVIACGKNGIYLQSGCDGIVMTGNKVRDNSTTSAGTYAGILLENVTDAVLVGNNSNNLDGVTQSYGIEESISCNNNTYIGNNVRNNVTGGMLLVGTTNTVRGNPGYASDSNITMQVANITTASNMTTGNLVIMTTDAAANNKGAIINLGGYYNGTTTQTGFGQIAGRKENGTDNNSRGYLQFSTNGVERMRIDSNARVGIGVTAVTAMLHLKAGSATANFAPLKFSPGTNLTTPEDGAVEYNGSHFYVTIGSTRYQLDQQSGGVISVNGSTGVVVLTTTNITEGSNLYYTDARVRANRLDQMAIPVGSVSLNSQKITSLADPTANQDAATKAYVDSVATGLDAKDSCRVATTTAGTLASSFENGDTVDGVVLVTGDRILIKNQVSGAENGIYIVNASGAPTRATDADTSAEVTSGLFTFITEGTLNGNTGWVLTTTGVITLGTTPLSFSQFSSATSITAGNGMILTGSTLDIVGTTNRITVAADSIDISSSYVGQTSITTLGTITTGTWNGSTITVANGGTGATTLTGILKGNGTSAFTAVTAPSGAIVGTTDVQTLTNKTLSSPVIADFTNANHTHAGASTGGQANHTDLTNIGTNTHAQIDSHIAATGSSVHGLGTISTQSASSVTITGGTITGITDLAVADGGTGSSTAAGALSNLGALAKAGDTMTGSLTITPTANPALTLQVSPTINTATADARGIESKIVFTGAGTGPAAIGAQPTFQPSANQGPVYGIVMVPKADPATGIAITTAYAGYWRVDTGSNGGTLSNLFTMFADAPTYGSVKPGLAEGVRIANQGGIGVLRATGVDVLSQSSGGTNAIGVWVDYPTVANGVGAVTDLIGIDLPTTSLTMGNTTGTTTNFFGAFIGKPTIAATTNPRTITNGASLYIEGAPTASTNVTFTNTPYAIWLADTGGAAGGGLLFGGAGSTSNLYRSAANTLKTDGNLNIVGSLTLGTALAIAQGGTGANTKTAAFDALSPNTTQGDIIYHNGTNNIRLAKGTAFQELRMNSGATAPEWATLNANARVTSNVTTTLATAGNVTGLSFTIAASEVWSFEINLQTGCSSTGGIKFAITTPSGATFNAPVVGMSTAVTALTSAILSASGTLSGVAFNTVALNTGWVRIVGTVVNSTTPGTVQLQFASATAGQTSTVFANSYITARKIG